MLIRMSAASGAPNPLLLTFRLALLDLDARQAADRAKTRGYGLCLSPVRKRLKHASAAVGSHCEDDISLSRRRWSPRFAALRDLVHVASPPIGEWLKRRMRSV